MIELSLIRDLVAIFGVIAGFSYYVLTVRNAKRNRDVQLFMQIYNSLLDPEKIAEMTELVTDMEWDDLLDFERKYGTSTGSYENYSKRYAYWKYFDGIGELLRRGLIEPELVYSLLGQTEVILFWDKFGSLILEYREVLKLPEYFSGFEYLAQEMLKIRKLKGHPTEILEKYGSALLG